MNIRNFKLISIMREKEDYVIIIKFLRYYLFGPTSTARPGYKPLAVNWLPFPTPRMYWC